MGHINDLLVFLEPAVIFFLICTCWAFGIKNLKDIFQSLVGIMSHKDCSVAENYSQRLYTWRLLESGRCFLDESWKSCCWGPQYHSTRERRWRWPLTNLATFILVLHLRKVHVETFLRRTGERTAGLLVQLLVFFVRPWFNNNIILIFIDRIVRKINGLVSSIRQ